MSENKKSKTLCTFYQRNACSKGDECQFSHIGPIINESSSSSAGGAKPKADSSVGANPQPICPWGYNCPIMRNGCPNKHVKMCSHGTECNKDGCTYYHHGK